MKQFNKLDILLSNCKKLLSKPFMYSYDKKFLVLTAEDESRYEIIKEGQNVSVTVFKNGKVATFNVSDYNSHMNDFLKILSAAETKVICETLKEIEI